MEKQSYRTLYNILLPFVIVVAFILRINFLSFVYFVFSLFLPLTVSPPTSQYPGHPYRFIICITLWSILCIIGQLLFNFVPWNSFLPHPLFPYDQQLSYIHQHHEERHGLNLSSLDSFVPEIDCHPFARWIRQIGFDKIQAYWRFHRILNLFASDLLVLACGALLLFRLKVLQRRRRLEAIIESGGEKVQNRRFSQVAEYLKIRDWSKRFENSHNAVLTVACCIVGALHPSMLSLPYFIMFIIFSTLWAFDRPLTRRFWFTCRRGILLYCAFHLSVIYIYQFPNVYRSFPSHEFIARILGLVHYQTFPCDRYTYPNPIISWIWPEFLSPIITFVFYYLLATQISIIREKEELAEVDSLFNKAGGAVAALVMKSKDGSRIALGYQVKDIKDIGSRKESSMSVKVPIADTPLASKKTSVTSLPSNTSKKSAKISLQFAEKLAAMKLERERMKNLAKWENLKPILETIKSYSYVLALIILMAWSLCYHSWSTFVGGAPLQNGNLKMRDFKFKTLISLN